MAPRTIRGGLVLGALALIAGLFGTAVKADPVYTVTNLGSGGVTLTTAGGGTIAVSQFGVTDAYPATSQLASVSNGQVSYSFATTPDTQLTGGQGLLAGLAATFVNPNPAFLGTPFLAGLLNTNGFAAIAVDLPENSNPGVYYSTAYAFPPSSNGELAWAQGDTIASFNSDYNATGLVTLAGVNTANQALVGTAFQDRSYDSLVYNLSSHALTDLDLLPQFSAGTYSNLRPLAIDNDGQILVIADSSPSTGGVTETLLLTPDGEPVVATPEPGAWATWVLIVGASWFAGKRGRAKS